ncbi:MBG domain-containing protein, partial [Aquitalea magnusonii]|uniref:MBG domain-containing protein n=1 Tax=Aquitalea magnusonii TaxID=332411 RepID=UPI000B04B677
SATLASAHAGNRALSGFNSLTLSDSDYTLTGATGSMTVNPLAVTLTGSQTYNGTTTAQGSNLTVSNLIEGDSVTVGGTAAMAGKVVGNQQLTALGGLSLSNADYTLSGGTGSLAVVPAALTITAANQTVTAGTPYVLSGYTTSGLFGSDTVSSLTETLPGGATSTLPQTPAGSYVITAFNATGSGLSNYNIAYQPGVLTINPLPAISVQQLPANGEHSNASSFSTPVIAFNQGASTFNPPAPSGTSGGAETEGTATHNAPAGNGGNGGIGNSKGETSSGVVQTGSGGGSSGNLQLARQSGEQMTGSPYPDNRYVGDAIQFMTQ